MFYNKSSSILFIELLYLEGFGFILYILTLSHVMLKVKKFIFKMLSL